MIFFFWIRELVMNNDLFSTKWFYNGEIIFGMLNVAMANDGFGSCVSYNRLTFALYAHNIT